MTMMKEHKHKLFAALIFGVAFAVSPAGSGGAWAQDGSLSVCGDARAKVYDVIYHCRRALRSSRLKEFRSSRLTLISAMRCSAPARLIRRWRRLMRRRRPG